MISGAGAPGYPTAGGRFPGGGAAAGSALLPYAIGLSAGFDILAGVFGSDAGEEAYGAAESRARLIRVEAEADAQRYAEQASDFKARQKLAYLKSGVQLSGSPLDVLDETARVSRENLSAIRARGEAQAQDTLSAGVDARMKGRAALIGGVMSAAKTGLTGAYTMYRNKKIAETPRNDTKVRY